MIRYAAQGERSYGEHPWAPHTRHSWEFQAVVAGRCALWLPGRQLWRTATLWLFPPECSHGWTAAPGSTCRVCVVQVAVVPDLLRLLAAEHSYLEIPLSPADITLIEELTAEAVAIPAGDPLAGIRGDVVTARLSLLVAERLAKDLPQRLKPGGTPERVVADAIAWLSLHLPERPTIAEAAAVVGCSPAHLRRLFTQVRRQSPNEVLSELRLRRVEELLGDRSLTLEQIAQQTGFSDGSTLSRAYRAARGQPPTRLSGRRQAIAP
jgi:AraC-like DNA-binding protein